MHGQIVKFWLLSNVLNNICSWSLGIFFNHKWRVWMLVTAILLSALYVSFIIMKQNFCNEISILWQLTWPTTKYYFANLIFFVHADMNLECSCKIELTTANKTCFLLQIRLTFCTCYLDNTRKNIHLNQKQEMCKPINYSDCHWILLKFK